MPQTSNGSTIVPLDNEEKAFIEQVSKELQEKVDSYMRKQQQELEVMLRAWRIQSLQLLVEERRKLKKQPQQGRKGKQTKTQQSNQQPQQPSQNESQQVQQESQQTEAQAASSSQNQTEKQPARRNQRKKGKKVLKTVEQDGEQPAEQSSNAATSEPAEAQSSAATTTTNQEKPAKQKKPQKKRTPKYVETPGEGKIDESKIQKFTVAELEVFFYQAPNSHLKKPIQCTFTSDPATIDVLAAQLIQESDNDVICMNCFWNERFGEDVNIDPKMFLIGFTFNNRVYLFHLANCEKDLPHKVKELLERDTLYKVAPGIKTDINQLYVDWNRVWVSGILDINIFVENSSTGSSEEPTLRNQSTILTALASKVLNYQFNIPNVAKRAWSKDLLAEQLDFAAKVCWLNWKILSTRYQEQSEYKSIRSWVDGALGSYLQF